ncbi:type III-B CRISPR module RAMP protein Cmr6 [Saccharolobus islandicus]|uniref:CRISPR-associated protein, Cmr6 n=1 Tax=Saccharolobus islandicus LAL14/1 TaxID=1241935 RepID=M9U7F6_SACIS|nr:type III-B CRISPR module RAMP protein Cmr6 [Sulfolobus islandicus]AGJ62067.1 CRISPR-associated protein, Cmr6 [Sulfolobus islandicus LAL14/1]
MNFGLSCINTFIEGILRGEDKEEIRKKIIERAENQTFNTSLSQQLTEEIKSALISLDYNVVDVIGRVNYKAISGLSEGLFRLIFEVGINYDEILDLPYIPGSTIKGVLRSNLYELTGDEGNEIFGDKEREGSVIVSDAYPIGEKLFVGDIVNPHYYQGGRPVSTEYDVNPVPILHLAIRENVKFRFLIGVDKRAKLGKIGEKLNVRNAVELVALLLLYSMKTGLGARSTKGYNFFEVERMEVKVNE